MNFEKILKEEQAKIAKENNLGNSLVTGHRKSYFDQASINAFNRILHQLNNNDIDETSDTSDNTKISFSNMYKSFYPTYEQMKKIEENFINLKKNE